MTHVGMIFIIAGLNINTQFIYMFFGVMRPGRRSQRLILVTKAIIQLVFKKEKKQHCSNLQPWHKKSAALLTELRG